MKPGYSFELSSLKGANTRFSTGTGPRLGFLVIPMMIMRQQNTKYQYNIRIQKQIQITREKKGVNKHVSTGTRPMLSFLVLPNMMMRHENIKYKYKTQKQKQNPR